MNTLYDRTMTKEDYTKKRNNWLGFFKATGTIIIAAVLGAMGSAYVDVKESKVNVQHILENTHKNTRKIEAYKCDADDGFSAVRSDIQKLDNKKVDKREIDNLKEYMGTQFNDIKIMINHLNDK